MIGITALVLSNNYRYKGGLTRFVYLHDEFVNLYSRSLKCSGNTVETCMNTWCLLFCYSLFTTFPRVIGKTN